MDTRNFQIGDLVETEFGPQFRIVGFNENKLRMGSNSGPFGPRTKVYAEVETFPSGACTSFYLDYIKLVEENTNRMTADEYNDILAAQEVYEAIR